MLKVIEDEGVIKRCQRQFVRSLQQLSDVKLPVKLGHPGASFTVRVSWSEQMGIWFCSRRVGDSRYWNVFGVEKPGGSSALPITCEINFPLRGGIDRKMGGALAADGRGRIFVVHRGKIGGGKRGVGKSLFEEHYRGAWATMEDGGVETDVVLVGMLKSPRFPQQVGQFVRKIGYIKRHADPLSSAQLTIFDETSPKEEFMGRGIDTAPPDPAFQCDYGLVIKDLSVLLALRGCRVGNDDSRDLFVVDDHGRVKLLFQLSTDPSTFSLHAGIAELLLQSSDLPERPTLVLILPVSPDEDVTRKLKKLDINVIAFEWEGTRAIFPGLDVLLSVCR